MGDKSFEQWWQQESGRFEPCLREMAFEAWKAGQKYMLDMLDTPVPRMPPISTRRYKMVPIEEEE